MIGARNMIALFLIKAIWILCWWPYFSKSYAKKTVYFAMPQI